MPCVSSAGTRFTPVAGNKTCQPLLPHFFNLSLPTPGVGPFHVISLLFPACYLIVDLVYSFREKRGMMPISIVIRRDHANTRVCTDGPFSEIKTDTFFMHNYLGEGMGLAIYNRAVWEVVDDFMSNMHETPGRWGGGAFQMVNQHAHNFEVKNGSFWGRNIHEHEKKELFCGFVFVIHINTYILNQGYTSRF